MTATSFATLLGCRAPVQLAPMPGIVTPALTAAVAEAGGLGMVPAPMLSPAALEALLDGVAARTDGAVGVNFLMPFLDRSCVPVAARNARAVEFFYGEPERALVDLVHAERALAGWQVGSPDEALAAVRAGCDYLVA